jgi:hypothetical protein
MGASRLERAEPHGGSPGQENYFTAGTLDSTLGAYVGLGEVTCTWRLNTGWPMAAESERGPRDRSVLSPMGSSPG